MPNDTRIPNTGSQEEVRRAFACIRRRSDIIDDGAAGEILVGAGVGTLPSWGTELTSITLLTVDNITIDGAVISSDTGAISFGNENLTTSGTISGVNVTSGNDPGHTHSVYLLADGSRALTADWTTGAFSIIGSDHWYIRADDKYLHFGAADDAAIYYNGTNLIVDPQVVGGGGTHLLDYAAVGSEVPGDHVLLNCRQDNEDNTQAIYGIRVVQTYGASGSGNQSNPIYGLFFSGGTSSAYNGDSSSSISGGQFGVDHRGSGTILTAVGLQGHANIASGGGDITNAYGVRGGIFRNGSAVGDITNAYGAFISDVSVGTSLNYALYTSAGTVSFQDDVHIRSDSKAIFFGVAQDASIYYDGGDLVLDPAAVGSGAFEVIGDMRFKGSGSGLPFAEIYGYRRYNTITISGTGLGNKAQITTFVSNGNRNQCTSDHSNDHVIISDTGRYLVNCSIGTDSIGGGTAANVGFGVYANNGSVQYINLSHRIDFAGGGGETQSITLAGIAYLTAGDTVEAWCWNETNTDDIVIDNITLAVVQVGGAV